MSERRVIIIFSLLHTGIFLGLFAYLGRHFYFGLAGFEHWVALQMLEGQVPYRDFAIEYPPLALLGFLLPGLFFRTSLAYGWAFVVEMLVLDLAALILVTALAKRLNLSVWRSLAIYTLALMAVGPIVVCRWDLLPTVLMLAALYAFTAGRHKLAWTAAALGVSAKAYPVVIIPFFVLYSLSRKEYRQLIHGIGAFVGVLLLIALPWILLSAEGFWDFFSYHSERGLHSETSYASVLLIGQDLGLTQVEGVFSFGSWNLSSPLDDNMARASPYVSLALLMALYGLCARSLWIKRVPGATSLAEDSDRASSIINYSLLAILVLLLTSKVFSAQFLVWLCPLLALVTGRWRHLFWLLFLAVGGLTQYIFPYHYVEFELGRPYLIGILATRNLLLAVVAFLLVEQEVASQFVKTRRPHG